MDVESRFHPSHNDQSETEAPGTVGHRQSEDDPVADFTPKVTDFGLAKCVAGESGLTEACLFGPREARGWTRRMTDRRWSNPRLTCRSLSQFDAKDGERDDLVGS